MRKIIRYEVLKGNSTAELSKVVLEFVDAGWELQGGVNTFILASSVFYCQSVIKYEAI